MASASHNIKVNITGESSGLRKAFGDAEKQAQGFGQKSQSVFKGMAKGALVLGGVATGVAVLGKGFYDAAIESQKIAKQTEAVIKSTGGVANVTAGEIDKLAGSLSMKAGVDDELIASGANMLLTFTNIRNEAGKGNDVFTQASKAALDYSVATGTDVVNANKMLGKALNDPIKGLSALSKAGVSFTQQQKDQIKAMVASGDTMGAQKIILAEFNKEFGGSAEAQATAGDKLKVIWGNVQEEIGKRLIPILEKAATWLSDNLPAAMEKATEVARDLWGKVETVTSFLGDHKEILAGVAAVIATVLVAAFASWAMAAGAAAIATLAATWPVLAVAAAIGLLVAGLVWAYNNVGWFKTAVDAVVTFLKEKAAPAFMWLLDKIKIVFGWLVDNWKLVLGIITGPIGAAVLIVTSHWDKIKGAALFVYNWIKDNWPLLLAILTGPFGLAVLAIVKNWDTIKAGATAVKDWVVDKWNALLGFFQRVPAAMDRALDGLFDGVKNAFKAAINFVIDSWNNLELTLPKVEGFGVTLGGGTIGTPDIPRLHSGGLVTGLPGSEQLRMLEAGEWVLSRDDVAGLSKGSGALTLPSRSGGDTIYNVTVHGSDLKPSSIVKAIKEAERQGMR